jgi:hypothetical protein
MGCAHHVAWQRGAHMRRRASLISLFGSEESRAQAHSTAALPVKRSDEAIELASTPGRRHDGLLIIAARPVTITHQLAPSGDQHTCTRPADHR